MEQLNGPTSTVGTLGNRGELYTSSGRMSRHRAFWYTCVRGNFVGIYTYVWNSFGTGKCTFDVARVDKEPRN